MSFFISIYCGFVIDSCVSFVNCEESFSFSNETPMDIFYLIFKTILLNLLICIIDPTLLINKPILSLLLNSNMKLNSTKFHIRELRPTHHNLSLIYQQPPLPLKHLFYHHANDISLPIIMHIFSTYRERPLTSRDLIWHYSLPSKSLF